MLKKLSFASPLLYLVLSQKLVKNGEGREAEKDVNDVCGELDAFLPVFPQHSSKSQK